MSYELTEYEYPQVDMDSQIKRHCRVPVDYNGDNNLLEAYFKAAVRQVESDANIILGYATCKYTGDETYIDCDNMHHFQWDILPLVSAAADIEVEYFNTSGVWTAADVDVILIPGPRPEIVFDASALVLHVNKTLPKFRITAQVGYNPDTDAADHKPLPDPAIPAILQWCAESYTFRETTFYARANASFFRSYNAKIAALRTSAYP